MALAAGTKLDGYEVVGLLGAGGMGEVYRVLDPALKREVAIKVLPSFGSSERDRLLRFEQEARAAAALNHPNILAIYRFGVFQGAPYLVSELLEGGTLRELLHSQIPMRKVIDYGVQIAHGLAAAHEKGIVHRDLKPENLFVTKDGRVKILDFGLAKLMQSQPEPDGATSMVNLQTNPSLVMGTVGYMSPEQVRGQTVDHRADIFAFGAILYEMLTGKRAFQRSTSAETMTAILNDDPSGIWQTIQTAPPGLQRVVHRCLEKNPEQRFQSASDLAFAVEALSEAGSGPVEVPTQDSRTRWLSPMAGAAVALVALLIGIAWRQVPPAVPVVESITQLTDDRQPKGALISDSSRIYLNEEETGNWKIAQVAVTGGAIAPIETPFANSYLMGIEPYGSAVLALVPGVADATASALWSIPLPAGEPRRLGNVETQSLDILPDGRIVFAQFVLGKDPKGSDSRTDWLIADKDGSNPRKLVSLPGATGAISVEPDGHRVLLEGYQNHVGTLFAIGVDGTGLREIWKERAGECCFTWTPNGKHLVYQSSDATQSDIWLLPMKTGFLSRQRNPIRLTNGPLSYSSPYPSKDGRQIFALGTKRRGELVRYDMGSHQFQPFLSGISLTDPTFSRDGKWVAYASYPDHALWRSRSDGSDRMQLTYPPVDVNFPSISPDGTKVAFHTDKGVFVISKEGGMPQRIVEDGFYATWSPDGNYLCYRSYYPDAELKIVDVRNGKNSVVPASHGMGGFWVSQDTLVAENEKQTNFLSFNLKTQKWTDLGPKDMIAIGSWMLSPDCKYLYLHTRGAEPKVERIRFADQRLEMITSLKGFQPVVNNGSSQINVAPDGSPLFTRDAGYQEIYALKIHWP